MSTSTQNRRGEWVPAIPLPFFGLFHVRCRCGKRFLRRHHYEAHYALRHILQGHPDQQEGEGK